MTRVSWLTAWVVAIASSSGDGPSAAAEDSAASIPKPRTPSAVEEIIVTAQKREQSLTDVPLSVAALTGEQIEAGQLRNLDDLQYVSPNLTIVSTTNPSAANFIIRGIGTASNDRGFEQSVGVYVDSVYRGRPAAAVLDLIDLERIEVLRGPQATLFGRNNTAGAVSIVTAKPSYEWSGAADVAYGEFDLKQARGMVSGPIVDELLAFRLSASHRRRDDGDFTNLVGDEYGGFERSTARGQVLLEPTGSTTIRLIGDYADADDRCCVLQPYFVADVDREGVFAGATLPGYDDGRRGENRGQSGAFIDVFERTVAMDGPIREVLEDVGVSAELNQGLFGIARLDAVGSRRANESRVFVDVDGSDAPNFRIHSFPEDEFDETYFEARLANDETGMFDWLGGYNYFHQTIDEHNNVPFLLNDAIVPTVVTNGLIPPLGENFVDYDAVGHGVFGETTWHMLDWLHLTGGMRYLTEEKDVAMEGRGTSPSGTNAVDDDAVIGSASLATDLAEGNTAYFRFAQGYKSGGINLFAAGTQTVDDLDFKPERATNYEIGGKFTLFDARLGLNVAAFRQKISDQQVQINEGVTLVTINAAEVLSQGVEAEWQLVPIERFALSIGLTYLDATYESFPNAPAPADSTEAQDLSGEPTYHAPKWTVSGGGEYAIPLLDGIVDLIGRVQARYKSAHFTTLPNDEMFENDGKVLLGASMELARASRRWSIQAWGRNLTDAELFTTGFFNSVTTASTAAGIQPPRTWGLTASYRF